MVEKSLTPYDSRPFFERTLRHGVKNGIIDQKKIDEILENGPKGMVQIAHIFGTEYLRPDLLRARNRIVNLVNLYLENASWWDLEKAAELLATNTFLSHSKGGSDMIKNIHNLPDTSILGNNTISHPLENSYDAYAPDKRIVSWLLSKYRGDYDNRIRNRNAVQACEWFMGKFPHLHTDDFLWHSAEWIFATLLLCYIEGVRLRTLPSRQEIFAMIQKNRWQRIQWDTIFDGAPAIHIPYIESAVETLENILKKNHVSDSDIWSFESDENSIASIDDYAAQVTERWRELTKGKLLSKKEKQTLLFSFLAGWSPQKDITRWEARKMIEYLAEHTPEYRGSIDGFLENNVPFEYHRGMMEQWQYLEKEIATLRDKDVSLDTKIWILQEAGCNFIKSRGKATKKVTTLPK